jgi:predicted MFS family arabinose efflux permease
MSSGSVIEVAVAAVIGVGIGWGWTGLFGYSVVHLFPHSPGAASAQVLSVAGGVGSAVGPFVMGLMIEHVGYGSTERVLSGVLFFAAAVMLIVRVPIRPQVSM